MAFEKDKNNQIGKKIGKRGRPRNLASTSSLLSFTPLDTPRRLLNVGGSPL